MFLPEKEGKVLRIYTEKNLLKKVDPDGGDGGRGGHVYIKGNKNLWTLFHLKFVNICVLVMEAMEEVQEVQVMMEKINIRSAFRNSCKRSRNR
jgi:GTPase involved in cell partitioning and DNA repair